MRVFGCVACVAVSGMIVVLSGCAKIPESELSNAKASLDSALAFGADKYVAVEFSAANDSLKAAVAEIEKQKTGLLGRNYDKAKALLVTATVLAHNAQTKALEEKQRMKTAVDSSLSKEDALMAETKQLLTKVPKGKDAKASLGTIENEIATIDASRADAVQAKSIENYPKAIFQINGTVAKLDSIKEELTTIIGKAAPKKSKK